MKLKRASGIILHPTSLPNSAGIGTLGKEAFRFVDWLKSAQQTLWQVLPIGPTGYGDSPYASFSTFAGNPLLIDLDILAQQKFIKESEIIPPEWISHSGNIDYGSVVYWKIPLIKKIAKNFLKTAKAKDTKSFTDFVSKNELWLENYATFMSIKEFYDAKAQAENVFGECWNTYWPKDLALCDPQAIEKWKKSHSKEIEVHKVIQFFFYTQWQSLKQYANENGVKIIGDIPIFVALDSADVWANQSLFQLDSNAKPVVVAGVPPDYFSATGQLWGNPLYNWKEMKKDSYQWWLNRIQAMLDLFDCIRIDHFRGFESYWAIPAGEKTAMNGKWIKGPDHDLFKVIKQKLGDISIIAEDLGIITEEVKALRDDFDLPGMKILQFAFDINEAGKGGCVNSYLPHMYSSTNCVVYTGTHDNATMQGWINEASEEELQLIKNYLGGESPDALCFRMIQLAFSSIADYCIIPLQDVLGFGNDTRMNTPSTSGGQNWQWRMDDHHFDSDKAQWLKYLSTLYARNLSEK
ncbi:MAG: 4-alpha-glucanotransferase [Treponemataceae bacterium]